MIKKITLTNVEVKKEGVSAAGQAWTLYECRDLNTRYSSFTNFSDKIGVPTDFDVVSKESDKINPHTNKPYVNYTIALPKAGGKAGNSDALFEKLFTRVNEIAADVKECRRLLEAEAKVMEPPMEDDPANNPPF
jgi:hypothetical protein